jgi:thioredoxin reductase (NADPH)
MKPKRSFDLLILCGGIAGMSASIFSARANINTAVIEQKICGGLANWTNSIENFPGFIAINGMALMEPITAHVQKLGAVIEEAAEVVKLNLSDSIKEVETSECIYTGKAIILATDREPISLQLETECENIHYCSVCDGSRSLHKLRS